MLPRQTISRLLKRVANCLLNFEALKIGYASLRHKFGTTKTERIGPRSGCIKSRWRLSRNSLASMIPMSRGHLLHKQFLARSDKPPSLPNFTKLRRRVIVSGRRLACAIAFGWVCGMGCFHAKGDCVSRSRGGMAEAGVGSDESSRERGGRKDSSGLGVAGQNARKAA